MTGTINRSLHPTQPTQPSPRLSPLVHDLLRENQHPLHVIFAPQTVAVIGASEKEGSVGRTILWNLLSSPFGGTIFPVNPKRHSVLGIKAYPTIGDIPEPVDLAVIVTPAVSVPGIIQECVAAGVQGAIIISAGFKETGATGIALEQQVLAAARQGNLRIIGPNCLGVMSPLSGLNATFASQMARPGSVGFISQSGALCTSILDWSLHENVGFSAFVSIGSMLDVNWGDLIDYLGDDPHTESIVIYMESIGNAQAFLSAAREVAQTKPIIVIKAGRTAAAAQAAVSHTGALAGSDAVLDAAFRRCGVLRVNSINDLFNMAEVLAKQPRPQNRRLTILTNAGGPGVLATDALITGGGKLAELAPETIAALDQILPPHWSHHNPIDILGDADPDRYAQAVEIAAQDPNSDGLLVVLTPQSMTSPSATAERLCTLVATELKTILRRKPLLASWMGGAEVAAGEAILNQAGIFTLPYPDAAAQVFNYMSQYSYNLRSLYETPALPQGDAENRALATDILNAVRESGRTLLTEYESKQLLAAYGIPVVETYVATSEDEAVQISDRLHYPVVLKLYSKTITHKTDVGGVQLNLSDADAVRWAYQAIVRSVSAAVGLEHFQGVTVQPMLKLNGYELIIGSSLDAQFGPVLVFGMGGQLVEVFRDRAIGLPPLNTTLARRIMEQTRIYDALKGVRGRDPIDLAALEELLVRFSHLVTEQPWIKEIDINPLFACPDALIALDARVALHDLNTPVEQLPKPAIRPYPLQYVQPYTLKDGTETLIRPIRPEDEPAMVTFHAGLSQESVYLRYAHLIKFSQRVAHERLTQICFIDYDRELALVVETTDPQTQAPIIVAAGRLSKLPGTSTAEFSILVSDRYQKRGIGTELLQRLIAIGKAENLTSMSAVILPDNLVMQHICRKLGFHFARSIEQEAEPMVQATLQLSEP